MNVALKNTINHFKNSGVSKCCDFMLTVAVRQHGFLISMEKVNCL